jgi:cytochrome c oxidase subunit 2
MAAPGPGRPPVNHIRRMLIIWVVASVIGIIAAVTIPRGLNGIIPTASERTSDYNLTLEVFTVLAAPVFMLVMVVAFYSLFTWRVAERPLRDGPPMRASRGVQFAWVAISAVLVTGLFAWGLIFLNRADAAPPPGSNVLKIYVTGEQWNWNYTYPQYGNAQSDVLEVPINRPILFQITSLDVVHSFSVPAWGLKEDAVPGRFTYIRVTPNQMGDYSVRCYELCGMFHAYMEGPVRVVSAADFAKWVVTQPSGYPWGIGGVGVPSNLGSPGAPTPVPTP